MLSGHTQYNPTQSYSFIYINFVSLIMVLSQILTWPLVPLPSTVTFGEFCADGSTGVKPPRSHFVTTFPQFVSFFFSNIINIDIIITDILNYNIIKILKETKNKKIQNQGKG